ncbi:MAG TPA: hypothetical protein VHO90_18705 [Bacteroidales bacterium]|nr:hypothetical protein [Bacteroidales bacterium]
MHLPEVRYNNISLYFNNEEFVTETAAQIMKDFGLFGVTITFSGDTSNAYNELHNQLVDQIESLLDRDYNRLLAVLYQVDIQEKDIAKSAQELPEYNHVEIIAHQIIERDLKKVLTRHYFKSKGNQ